MLWISKDSLVDIEYASDKDEITITCGTFNNGTDQQVSGFDYVLYYNGSYAMAKDLIKPGYLIDDSVPDYGVGPYTLTKTAAATTSARHLETSEPKFLNDKLQPSKKLVKNLPVGAYGMRMISVR